MNHHSSYSLAFSLFGIGASSFLSPCSPVFLYSFLLNAFSYNITPPQFSLTIFRCPLSSMFSLLHHQSLSPHGLTASVSLLLFSYLCLPHLSSLMSSVLIFSILFILNILVSVLSSKFCSAFLSSQISLPYIRTEMYMEHHCCSPI